MSYQGSGAPVAGNVGGGQVSRIQRFSGSVVGAALAGVINLPIPEPDNTYQVIAVPQNTGGAPAAGSNRITTIGKSATQVTINVEVAPGVGNSVVFDIVTFR